MNFEQIALILGRFHPVIVHFPIALILIATLWEGWRMVRRISDPSPAAVVLLYICIPATILASALGWLNASTEEFHGELEQILLYHRWGGIAVAVLSVFIGWLAHRALRHSSSSAGTAIYRALLLVTAALVGAVGHYGGLMVHGPDYYSFDITDEDGARASMKSPETASDLPPPAPVKVTFAKDIHPILQANCGKCHLDGRKKGGFAMDTREQTVTGGDSGAGAIPGDSANSLFIRLVSGSDPKKVMPNKGRRLTPEEISLLRAWVDQGLSYDGEVQKSQELMPKAAIALERPTLPDGPRDANPVDRIVREYFRKHGILSTAVIDDRRFARKLYFDLLGIAPPPEELEPFLRDTSPDKRGALVRKLLADDHRFALHWLTFWNDALRNDYSGPGFLHGGRKDITRWIYSSLYTNKPYSAFAAELIDHTDETQGFLHGIRWWRQGNVNANEEPGMQAAQNVAQVFMGINLKCASCHDSFVDDWKLSDAYGFANIFSASRLTTHRCNVSENKVQAPSFLYPELGAIELGGGKHRRRSAAALMTSEKNGRFARTIVNRLWQRFYGRGIVEPVDAMDNKPWSPELLDWLAAELIEQKFDLRKIMEIMLTSRAYQLPTQGAAEHYAANWEFRGPMVRRVDAEQLFDSLAAAYNVVPNALSSDVERALAVTAANPLIPASVERKPTDPRILARSGSVDADTKAVKLEADISSAKSLWLVVVKNYATKSALDREREQFEKVTQRDDGKAVQAPIQLGTESVQAKKDKTGNKLKGAKRSKKDEELFHAFWDRPTISLANGGVVNVAKEPTISFLERMTMENEQEGGSADDLVKFENVALRADGASLEVNAFSAVRVDLTRYEGKRFSTMAHVEDPDPNRSHKVEFLLVADLDLRAVFLEATPTLLALGRPRREQIATTRPTVMTTMQAFEMTNGPGVWDLMQRVAESAASAKGATTETIIDEAYRRLLGRAPSKAERENAVELLAGRPLREQASDLIWSIAMLPEYQLLM